VQHPAVRQHGERHRFARLVVQRHLLVVADHGGAAVAFDDAGGPLDAAEQVLPEVAVPVGLDRVAEPGVPGTPALEILAPGHRVVEPHGAAGVAGLVHGRQHVRGATDVGRVVVPLLGERPVPRHGLGRRVCPVGDPDGRLGDCRRAGRSSAEHAAVEGPVLFRLGGGVYADVAPTVAEVRLEGGLLGRVQYVAGGVEEHHGPVVGQIGRGESAGVLRDGDGEPVRLAQCPDGAYTVRDGRAPSARRLREHQHLVAGRSAGCGAQCGRPVLNDDGRLVRRGRPGWWCGDRRYGDRQGNEQRGDRGYGEPSPAGHRHVILRGLEHRSHQAGRRRRSDHRVSACGWSALDDGQRL
jgi:hypothetical protein